jgi:hypothetical protein
MAKLQYEIDDRRLFFAIGVRTSYSGDIRTHLKSLGYDEIEIELVTREYQKGCTFIAENPPPKPKRIHKKPIVEENPVITLPEKTASKSGGYISPEDMPVDPETGTVKAPVKTQGKAK